MTALYGGGVVAGENDIEDPFRVPSIRGQLRFWWRATAGGRCESVDELRREEEQLWGSTEHASRVRLRILNADRGSGRLAAGPGPDGRWQKLQPDYALFPAQEDRRNIGEIYIGGRFSLEVALPTGTPESALAEIDRTLWAWVTFGGIGGRTRRGAGALYCPQYLYSWKADAFQGTGASREWPILKGGTVVIGSRPSSWPECWEECIRLLRDFRQDRLRPRGRSRWPEPDAIRILRDKHAPHHAPMSRDRIFPRAALGLPIIFHFKTPEDPTPNTLNVLDRDDKETRMASPVILKPWAISPSEAISLLVVLNAPEAPKGSLALLQAKPKAETCREEADFDRGDGKAVLRNLVARAERDWAGRKLLL